MFKRGLKCYNEAISGTEQVGIKCMYIALICAFVGFGILKNVSVKFPY